MLKITESKENKKFDYDNRIKRLRNLTKETILITKNENIFYLTGFKGTAGWLLIHNSKKYLLVDSRYFEQATKITHKTSVVLVSNNYEGALFCIFILIEYFLRL